MYDGVYPNPHIMQTQYHPHGMAAGINPNASIYNNLKPKYPKKVSNKPSIGIASVSPPGIPHNGMIAAMHPAGTIHVGGQNNMGGTINNGSIMMGMMSTDFKNTMKHNSSNHSIQTKKMLNTIRKPADFFGGFGSHGSKKGSGSYLSPYSQKMVAKGQHNLPI
jgi:hypothetical protein